MRVAEGGGEEVTRVSRVRESKGIKTENTDNRGQHRKSTAAQYKMRFACADIISTAVNGYNNDTLGSGHDVRFLKMRHTHKLSRNASVVLFRLSN